MKGFTLIEILVVIAILVLLSALVWPPFMDFKRNESLRAVVLEVESVLQQARSETLAARGGNNFGVKFEVDRVTLFIGNSYDSLDPTNRVTLLPKIVNISNIELTGDSTVVVFERLTGRALSSGRVDIALVSDVDNKQSVFISPLGVIEVK